MVGTLLGALVIFAAGSIVLRRLMSPRTEARGFAASSFPPGPSKRFLMQDKTSPSVQGAPLSKCEAEDLLDWLEATGQRPGQVSYVPGQGFAVR